MTRTGRLGAPGGRGRGVSFAGRRRGPAFAVWEISLAPGHELRCAGAGWLGGLVEVERGAIEVVCASGARGTSSRGAVLFLGRLRPRALRNGGRATAVLSAVARRGRCWTTGGPLRAGSSFARRPTDEFSGGRGLCM